MIRRNRAAAVILAFAMASAGSVPAKSKTADECPQEACADAVFSDALQKDMAVSDDPSPEESTDAAADCFPDESADAAAGSSGDECADDAEAAGDAAPGEDPASVYEPLTAEPGEDTAGALPEENCDTIAVIPSETGAQQELPAETWEENRIPDTDMDPVQEETPEDYECAAAPELQYVQPDSFDVQPDSSDVQPDSSDVQPGISDVQPDFSDAQPDCTVCQEAPEAASLPVWDGADRDVSSPAGEPQAVDPELKVTKTLLTDRPGYEPGDTARYGIVVENNGNVALQNVKVEDSLTGLSETIEALEPGEQRTFTTEYTVVPHDIPAGMLENTVIVMADDVPDPLRPGLAIPVGSFASAVIKLKNRLCRLKIRYWVDQRVYDSYTGVYEVSDTYEVQSPVIPGYTTDEEAVAGMLVRDVERDVYYTKSRHVLRIRYLSESGDVLAEDRVLTLGMDQDYLCVSPEVAGYVPGRQSIRGTMPDKSVEYTVIYSPAGNQKDPGEDPGNGSDAGDDHPQDPSPEEPPADAQNQETPGAVQAQDSPVPAQGTVQEPEAAADTLIQSTLTESVPAAPETIPLPGPALDDSGAAAAPAVLSREASGQDTVLIEDYETPLGLGRAAAVNLWNLRFRRQRRPWGMIWFEETFGRYLRRVGRLSLMN